ncbi:MAG: hypothetical protein WCY27_00420 [archaeon]|nr:hypothetical protein [archaeon]MDD3085177.1 hypothetical protein [Candidatus ainarchaeum sp.]
MNEGIRLFIGALLFYIIYRTLAGITDIIAYPIYILILTFVIYMFIPDMANDSNAIKSNKNQIGLISIIVIAFILLVSKFIVNGVTFLIIIIIFALLIKNRKIFQSFPAGLLLSSPLYFINPIYFIFAFVGFLSFWISNKLTN